MVSKWIYLHFEDYILSQCQKKKRKECHPKRTEKNVVQNKTLFYHITITIVLIATEWNILYKKIILSKLNIYSF